MKKITSLFLFFLIVHSFTNAQENSCIKFPEHDRAMVRPELPYNISNERFIVHYDNVAIENYAQRTLNHIEYAYQIMCGEYGWRVPPEDFNNGGDNRYDIYLVDEDNDIIFGYNGITVPEIPGNWQYEWAPSFIVMVNNLQESNLKMVTAHELNHACQIAYTYRDAESTTWFYENTAVYIAEEVYDYMYLYFLGYFTNSVNPLDNPELAINSVIMYNKYQYAGFLWPKFLNEWVNNTDIVRAIWAQMGETPGYFTLDDIDLVLTANGRSIEEAYSNYAIWRYFTGGVRADDFHFKYASVLPTSKIDGTFNSYPVNGDLGMYGPGGTRFIELKGDKDVLDISMDGADLYNGQPLKWKGFAMEIKTPQASAANEIILNSSNEGSIRVINMGNTVVFVPVFMSEIKNRII
ncbi:MAG: hypothetical protein Q8Q47_07230, partial [Ignavibacteriaceae bacterium]|nr:hypothetical protein [Ignavibacteriaceae bacterium]